MSKSRNSSNQRSKSERSEPQLTNVDVSEQLKQIFCRKFGPLRVIGDPLNAEDDEPKAKKSVAIQTVSEVALHLNEILGYRLRGCEYWRDKMTYMDTYSLSSSQSSVDMSDWQVTDDDSSNVELSIFEHSRDSLTNDEEEAKPTNEIDRQLVPEVCDQPIVEKPTDWKALIPRQRVRGVCFTVNNYTERDLQKLRDQYDAGMFTYLVVGRK